MINYLHSFLSVDAPEDLREKIRLTNYIAVVVSLVAFPYIFIFRTYSEDLSNVVILIIASFLTVVVLSKLRYYTFSRFFLLLTTNITAAYYAASFGEAAGIQYLFFSYLGLPLIIFDFHKVKQIFFGCLIPVLCILYLEISAYYSPTFVLTSANFQNNIRLTSIFFVSLIIISSLISLIKSLKHSYDALQTAYTDLQAQQNLLEKTWQEYGFTSKLSGTLRLAEIVDLTAKTILQHFDLRYVATVSSGDTSTLETWVLDNGIPIRTRQDIFESQICYTCEKGPILSLSAAQLSSSVLEILVPIPESVLHLAITESESRYILIGPKKSGLVFSDSDLKLLLALSTQAITALQRALPYEDAVHRYGLAIKQESAYQMLVSLQHQINSPLSAAKMAMDTLSKTSLEDNNSAVIAKMGKEALDSVVAVMRRMRQISQLRETTYLGDIKMWDIGDAHIPSVTKP